MRGTTLGIVVLMLVEAGSPVAARDSAPLQVGAVTVLAGEQPRRFEVEVTASNAAIDLAMVDREGQVLPAGLSVHGGSGFRGFLLTERGHFDGLVVVALQLPETDHRTDGSIVHGIGWGQTADGQPCTRCEIPAGTYDLHLLAGGVPFGPEEQEWGSTEVTMLVENAEGTVTLGPDDGEPLFAFQQSGREVTNSNDSSVWSGGFWGSWAWKSTEWHGLLIDQMTVSFTGRTLPPLRAHAELCRQVGDDIDCETDSTLVSDHRVGEAHVTAFALPPESTVGIDMTWDVIGDADYRAIQNLLLVDLSRFMFDAWGEEDPGQELNRETHLVVR